MWTESEEIIWMLSRISRLQDVCILDSISQAESAGGIGHCINIIESMMMKRVGDFNVCRGLELICGWTGRFNFHWMWEVKENLSEA